MKRSIFIKKLSGISLIAFIWSIGFSPAFSQNNILISNGGAVSVYDGDKFYDAGGASGVDGNTNYTITLNPAAAGESVCLDFIMFNTYYDTWYEKGDSVCIFDGPSTSANKIATLMGNYSIKWDGSTKVGIGPTPTGGIAAVLTPTIFCASNSTGSLTISFYNYSSTASPGWEARITTYHNMGTPGCNIDLTASDDTICSGNSVILTATGDIVSAPINNNFNSSNVGAGWQATASAMFTSNVCSSPGLDGSVYLWMANAPGPRTLTTNPMDVSNGGVISFDYRQASVNSAASPCESPDINMSGSTPEAIYVQYSIDGGTTWTTFKTMFPINMNNVNSSADYYPGCGYEVTKWNKVVIPIPSGAETSNTMFRWHQQMVTSSSTDNWGLDNVLIATPNSMTITLKDITNNVVLGTSNASPYTYTVSPTVTTTYEATISDGISSCSHQFTVNVTSCGCVTPIININTPQTLSCSLPSISLNAAGSSTCSNYTYQWTSIGGGNIVSGANTLNPVVNQPGTYTLVITNTNGNCTQISSVNVTSNNVLPTISLTASPTAICSGGSSTLTATGGSSYTWDNGLGTGSAQTVSPSSTTTYHVTGTNASGCTNTASVVVTVNSTPTISASASPTPICIGGSSTLTATGGGSYSWDNGLGAGSSQTVSPSSTTTYHVTGTNASGCINTASVVVTVNSGSFISISASPASICIGGSSVLTASGATSYVWDNGLGTGNTHNVTPLSSTNYSVTATDLNGCTNTANVSLAVNSLPGITVSASPAVICNGSPSLLTANGGVSYTWDNGLNTGNPQTIHPSSITTYHVTGTDVNGCTNTALVEVNVNPTPDISISASPSSVCMGGSSTLSASGGISYIWDNSLGAGSSQTVIPQSTTTYHVTGTDANGCTNVASVALTVNQAPAVSISASPDSVCIGGSSLLTASGALTYIWDNNLGTGISQTIIPVSTTTYHVTGTDVNGCTNTSLYTLTVHSLPNISASASLLAVCNGSSSTLSASGGVNYTWDNNLGVGNNIVINPLSTTTYNVTGTDANGCVNTAQIQISVTTVQASISSQTNVTCFNGDDGNATVIISGGIAPYNYHWVDGQVSPTAVNLHAGNYTVTATDATGCSSVASLVINSPSQIQVVLPDNQQICANAEVSIPMVVSGGTAPYTYYWNGMAGNSTFTFTPNGIMVITGWVKDINGCSSNVDSVKLTMASQIEFNSTSSIHPVCPGNPVTINGSITNGIPPYHIMDQNGNTVTLPLTLYPQENSQMVLIATDACNSSDSLVFDISVNSIPYLTINTDITQGCQPLTVHFNELNPGATVSVMWNFGDQNNISLSHNPVHTYTNPGTYDVVYHYTTTEGCSSVITYPNLITVYPEPTARFTFDPLVASTVNPEINYHNYSENAQMYLWSFGDGDSSVSVNPYHRFEEGTYTTMLVAISDKGCRDSVSVIIKIEPVFVVYIPTAFSPDGDGINDMFFVSGNDISSDHFSMLIFDRWGEKIFETDKFDQNSNVSDTWDGRVKGNALAPVGIYTCMVICQNRNGQKREITGKVTVIR